MQTQGRHPHPKIVSDFVINSVTICLNFIFYNFSKISKYIHMWKSACPAQYWRDPFNISAFQEKSSYLALLNNERVSAANWTWCSIRVLVSNACHVYSLAAGPTSRVQNELREAETAGACQVSAGWIRGAGRITGTVLYCTLSTVQCRDILYFALYMFVLANILSTHMFFWFSQWFGFFKENSTSEVYGLRESPEYKKVSSSSIYIKL